jgi:hypothetical protein
LLIVGGFNGKFQTDFFILTLDVENDYKIVGSKHNATNPNNLPSMFPFQVPTIASIKDRKVITVDWQYMTIHEFKGDKLHYLVHS